MVVAVVVLAGLLRTWKLSEWSLWEDEVITLIYVHHLDAPYINGFPLLFHVLKGLDRLPAETLLTGRVLAAVCGVVSVGLTYACFRSFVGRPAALLAALLLTLNLGTPVLVAVGQILYWRACP